MGMNPDSKHIAVIDMGTNTFNLLIGHVEHGFLVMDVSLERPAKLGAGGALKSGMITTDAQQRAFSILTEFQFEINRFHVNAVKVVGTSAIRDARNGAVFMQQVANQFGWHTRIISGDDEALLIYRGVNCSLEKNDETILVMDIGGGSVEFIIGKGDTILWKKSYALGAVRLLDRFSPEDPISLEQVQNIMHTLKIELQEFWKQLNEVRVTQLIGSAGSFESLRDVIDRDLQMECKPYNRYCKLISKSQFNLFCRLMFNSKREERIKLDGIPEYRVDTIVIASLLMQVVVEAGRFKDVLVSPFALREGLFFST